MDGSISIVRRECYQQNGLKYRRANIAEFANIAENLHAIIMPISPKFCGRLRILLQFRMSGS